ATTDRTVNHQHRYMWARRREDPPEPKLRIGNGVYGGQQDRQVLRLAPSHNSVDGYLLHRTYAKARRHDADHVFGSSASPLQHPRDLFVCGHYQRKAVAPLPLEEGGIHCFPHVISVSPFEDLLL